MCIELRTNDIDSVVQKLNWFFDNSDQAVFVETVYPFNIKLVNKAMCFFNDCIVVELDDLSKTSSIRDFILKFTFDEEKKYLIIIPELTNFLIPGNSEIIQEITALMRLAELSTDENISVLCVSKYDIFDSSFFSFCSNTLQKLSNRFIKIHLREDIFDGGN